MNVATKANVRTANAAKEGGMNKALSIAFSGGAVMGMSVVGLGLLGITAIYLFTKDVSVLTGFSLGASSIALFALRRRRYLYQSGGCGRRPGRQGGGRDSGG